MVYLRLTSSFYHRGSCFQTVFLPRALAWISLNPDAPSEGKYMQIEPDRRHAPILIEEGAGVGITLHIDNLGPQQFIVTRDALVQRFDAVPTDAGLMEAFLRHLPEVEAAAAMKLNTTFGDVAILHPSDFPAR
jgi:hypothetical protein